MEEWLWQKRVRSWKQKLGYDNRKVKQQEFVFFKSDCANYKAL